jgi:D-alanyl-D-alanine carboxypeptidase/D-alanyl-D-alanine-endopeptidase (penicillin-binding protein 4)
MARRDVLRTASAFAAGLVLALAAPAARAAELGARLDAIVGGRLLRGAQLGALVVAREDGRVLYARNADLPLVPASNQKLLTALAALAVFGPAHQFTTTVSADAAPDAEGAVGALYVRGGGDPALNSEDWWRLAADLRARGLRRVRGDVVLDDSLFDAERWHPEWGAVSSRAYYGPVGALNANYGAFAVEVSPGPAVDAPARVALSPPLAYFSLASSVRTAARGASQVKVATEPTATGESVAVTGKTPAGASPKRIYRSVSDPARYAGAVLVWQLAAQGVRVDGRLRRGASPSGARELLAFQGRPLAEIVRLFLKYSNNNVAETLVKGIAAQESGPPGSWSAGVAAMSQRLRGLGLGLDGARLVDGSGLSRGNRVSARLLVSALRAADRSFGFGPELESALPIAAADGTLAHRARGAAGAVRAKTGHLDGVTSLSGYAALAGGGEALFAVLVNGAPAGDAAAIAGLDAFAAALVGERPPATAAPASPLEPLVR